MLSSCQKDSDVKDNSALKASIAADSIATSSPGNFLAAAGTLTLKIQDSTYVFDASKDSIAFINVRDEIDDSKRYFGITAINKDHNMSFGISSSGLVHDNKNGDIAGSQFLLSPGYKEPGFQYSLSKYAGQKDFGNIHVDKYNQDSVLAKGTFHAFLAAGDKASAPVYKVEGSFDLKLK
ncbi:hypothetical protein MuYL_1255 [Mucilaginibacter xinganensis]|uniref:Uncharacterized protein n=2 Tax=Mucilaginibacter xinganensis TaxID=1234841 RepID=A0A223NTG0_9SPHI|nr:hypothetical protein MuYL_1255 [Mucilaginibacter xinganensis]